MLSGTGVRVLGVVTGISATSTGGILVCVKNAVKSQQTNQPGVQHVVHMQFLL